MHKHLQRKKNQHEIKKKILLKNKAEKVKNYEEIREQRKKQTMSKHLQEEKHGKKMHTPRCLWLLTLFTDFFWHIHMKQKLNNFFFLRLREER